MTTSKNITLIGSGNVATHLGMALLKNGFSINQVYSYSKDNAFELASKLNAMPCDDIKFITNESDVYIICIKDDFIKAIVNQFHFKDKLIVHTSGNVAMDVLNEFDNYGIFYPLQTFSKEAKININEVPFCIEANNKNNQDTLLGLANILSNNVYEIDSEQRKKLHLAAVFACNFSNYMYTISEKILSQSNIDFDILKPLILETAKKIQSNSPTAMQTGPAKRNDTAVINNQLEMLADNKGYQKVYKLMSEAIIEISTKK